MVPLTGRDVLKVHERQSQTVLVNEISLGFALILSENISILLSARGAPSASRLAKPKEKQSRCQQAREAESPISWRGAHACSVGVSWAIGWELQNAWFEIQLAQAKILFKQSRSPRTRYLYKVGARRRALLRAHHWHLLTPRTRGSLAFDSFLPIKGSRDLLLLSVLPSPISARLE